MLEAKDLVEEPAATYRIAELVFDPWRFGQAAQELRQGGIPVVEFPQSDSRMVPASDPFTGGDRAAAGAADHDQLPQYAGAAIARHGRRGWRLDKGATATFDAPIALCMALERAEKQLEPARLVAWL